MKAYDDYFAEIINTMERDYALGSVSASEERNIRYSNALLTGAALRELDELMMAQIFSAYIEAFADRNAYIRAPGYISEREVHAVRKDDRLFVLRSNSPSLGCGAEIISVDDAPVVSIARDNRNLLSGRTDEDEAWDAVLRGAQSVELISSGSVKRIELMPDEALASAEVPSLDVSSDGTTVFRIPDFRNPRLIAALAEECDVSGTGRLVLDVRGNQGGLESAMFPLLRFITGRETCRSELFGSRTVYTNYSEANCVRFIAALDTLRKTGSPEALKAAESAEREIRDKLGAGFVREELELEDAPVSPSRFDNTVILTDGYTANECADFCRIAHRAGFAILAGRPCMASRGTLMPVSLEVTGKIRLIYPTAVTESAFKSGGEPVYTDVDEYIGFSERELRRDAMLESIFNIFM